MLDQDFQNLKATTVEEMQCVGRCYEAGDGVGKDQAEAVKWYRMAAEQGLPQAMFELCKCYKYGIGVRCNRTTASKWLDKAAERGHSKALVLLGIRYSNECEAEYNPRRAVRFFRKAADQGNAWGMFHLAECLEHGEGVKKDYDAAYLWFCRAVVTSPEDELLYDLVQNQIFDPNLKECREQILAEKKMNASNE